MFLKLENRRLLSVELVEEVCQLMNSLFKGLTVVESRYNKVIPCDHLVDQDLKRMFGFLCREAFSAEVLSARPGVPWSSKPLGSLLPQRARSNVSQLAIPSGAEIGNVLLG